MVDKLLSDVLYWLEFIDKMGSDESKPSPQEQQERAKAMEKQRAQEKKVSTQIKAEQLTNNLDVNL